MNAGCATTRTAGCEMARRESRGLLHLAQAAWAAIYGWQSRARGRHQLSRLDDRMLRDIGLSRADVQCEVDKPFWR